MEALAVLDPAVRSHPDSEELLRELSRLYRDAGLPELAYRPLREIEKNREAGGKTPEAALLRELAEVCRDIGPRKPEMYPRSLRYWQQLETTTGTSTVAERHDTLAHRARQHQFGTRRLLRELQAQNIDEAWLTDLESRDNIFPSIDYRVYAS